MTNAALDYVSVPPRDRAAAVPHGAYGLLALLCAAAAIAYVQRSGIAVAAGSIQQDLGLDKVRFGTVLSAWSLGYALMQIPSGWLADRLGSRRALALFALLWSGATGLTGFATGYYSLVALWALMGIAQAGIFPCSTKAMSRWFPTERRASATGLLASCMGIGGALAPMLTGLLLTTLAWRWVFFLYALPGIAWGMLFYRMARDAPPTGISDTATAPAVTGAEAPPAVPVPAAIGAAVAPRPLDSSHRGESPVWLTLVTSESMWLLCAQQFLRAFAIQFFASWFPTYLREARGATLVQSGFLTTLAGAGLVLGSLLGGFASDRLLLRTGSRRLSRQGIAVLGMTGCAALIVCAFFVADRTAAVALISARAFCGAFGGVSGYTVAMDLGGRRVAKSSA